MSSRIIPSLRKKRPGPQPGLQDPGGRGHGSAASFTLHYGNAGGALTVIGVLSDPLPASLVANVAEIDARNALREHPGTSPGDEPPP